MMRPFFKVLFLILSMGLLLLIWNSHAFFVSVLQAEHHQSTLVLAKSLMPLLDHAHRLNDDLILQSAVRGFGQAPGISSAGITDANGRLLAHTQPSRLGQKIVLSKLPSRIDIYPLQDHATPWGYLLIQASCLNITRWEHHHAVLSLGMSALLTTFLLVVMGGYCQISHQVNHQLNLVRAEMEDQHKMHQQDLTDARCQQRLFQMSLQQAMTRIEKPMVLLDAQQRLVAFTPRAIPQLMGRVEREHLLGRFWLEIPALAACGLVLEKSLANPGHPVIDPSGLFITEVLESCGSVTWIEFRDPSPSPDAA